MSRERLSRPQSPIRHYHFPSIGITYTDIPKNGSTSLKNFFVNLERFTARKGGLPTQNLRESEKFMEEKSQKGMRAENLSLKVVRET